MLLTWTKERGGDTEIGRLVAFPDHTFTLTLGRGGTGVQSLTLNRPKHLGPAVHLGWYAFKADARDAAAFVSQLLTR